MSTGIDVIAVLKKHVPEPELTDAINEVKGPQEHYVNTRSGSVIEVKGDLHVTGADNKPATSGNDNAVYTKGTGSTGSYIIGDAVLKNGKPMSVDDIISALTKQSDEAVEGNLKDKE